jgi:hypothetical protein
MELDNKHECTKMKIALNWTLRALLLLIVLTFFYYVTKVEDFYYDQKVINASTEGQIHALNEQLLKAQEEGIIAAQGLDAAGVKIAELTATIEELKIKGKKK